MQNSQQWRDESMRKALLRRFYPETWVSRTEMQIKEELDRERGVRELDVLNDPNNWYDPFKSKEPECQSTIS